MSKSFGGQTVIVMIYYSLQEMRIYRCGCLQFMKFHKIGGDGYGIRQYINSNNTYVSIYNNCTSGNYCDTLCSTIFYNKPKTR